MPMWGPRKPVTVSGLALIGADANDYQLTQPSLTADISPHVLTITANDQTLTYGDSNLGSSAFSTSGLQDGETVGSVTLNTNASLSSSSNYAVGTWTITASGVSGGTFDSNNYNVSDVAGPLTVNPLTVTVTGLTAGSKVYDGTLTATVGGTGTMVGLISGDVVTVDTSNAVGNFADKNVGHNKTVTITGVTLSGADAGDYQLSPVTTTAAITPASLTVTGITADDKVYDGTPTATLSGLDTATLVGIVGSDDVSVDPSSSYLADFNDANVGTGKPVTVSGLALIGADANDYQLTQPSLTADISPHVLTITANDQTLTYGDSNLGSSAFSTSGLQDGETVGSVTLNTNASLSSSSNYAVGTWTITASGVSGGTFDSNNYNVSYVAGTLTVNPLTVTVTGLTAGSKVYDGTLTATVGGTGTMVGLISGDVVTVDTSNAVGNFADKNVGHNKTVTITGVTLSGADAGDYQLSPVTTTAAITPASLTVTADDVDKTYGDMENLDGTGVVALASSLMQQDERKPALWPDDSPGWRFPKQRCSAPATPANASRF